MMSIQPLQQTAAAILVPRSLLSLSAAAAAELGCSLAFLGANFIGNPVTILATPTPSGIDMFLRESGDLVVLRLEWRNYRVGRDNVLVFFYLFIWSIFAAATVWLTYCVLFSKIENGEGDLPEWIGWICFGIWLIVGWGVTVGLPFHLLGLVRHEWVEISRTEISFGQKGLLAPNPVTVAIADVQELFLGHVGDAGDRESFLTMNVNSSRGRDRWGDWLSPRVKIRVFKLVEDFVAKYSIRLRLRFGDEELRSIA